MKLRTCSVCKKVLFAQYVRPCQLDNKPAFACQNCLKMANPNTNQDYETTPEKLKDNINNGKIKIRPVS